MSVLFKILIAIMLFSVILCTSACIYSIICLYFGITMLASSFVINIIIASSVILLTIGTITISFIKVS